MRRVAPTRTAAARTFGSKSRNLDEVHFEAVEKLARPLWIASRKGAGGGRAPACAC